MPVTRARKTARGRICVCLIVHVCKSAEHAYDYTCVKLWQCELRVQETTSASTFVIFDSGVFFVEICRYLYALYSFLDHF